VEHQEGPLDAMRKRHADVTRRRTRQDADAGSKRTNHLGSEASPYYLNPSRQEAASSLTNESVIVGEETTRNRHFLSRKR